MSPADTEAHQHSLLPFLGSSFIELHNYLDFHNLDCLRTPADRKYIDIRSHHRQDTNYWKPNYAQENFEIPFSLNSKLLSFDDT